MLHEIIAEYMTAQYLQARNSETRHIKNEYVYIMSIGYDKEPDELGSSTHPDLQSKVYDKSSKPLCDLNDYSYPVNWSVLYSDNEYDINCPNCLELSKDLYDSKFFYKLPTK